LVRLHSKKAIGVLSEIWRAVPMAVVKNIPNAVADEKKLKDIVAQCGAVDAVRIITSSVFDLLRPDAAHSPICTLETLWCVRNADCA
jgi:hypothetical protein